MPERPTCSHDDAAAWFGERLPADWFDGDVRVVADKDEIMVIGRLVGGGSRADCEAVADRFREATRDARVAVALDAEARWQRKISWAVECADLQVRFSTSSVPVMTRLRIDERTVLDTLIDAGVARSRSEALAWCVRLVGQHQGDWIERLRDAMQTVEQIRAEGPRL
ncbi:MAG: hypothetical protein AAGA99_02345 [Actinomycetota bacterium]